MCNCPPYLLFGKYHYPNLPLKQLQRQLLAVHVVLTGSVQLVGQIRTTMLRLMERQAAFLAAKQLPGRALQVGLAALFTWLGVLILSPSRWD